MKAFILNLLKTKFAGLSEDMYSRTAAKLAETATTEESANSAVEELTLLEVVESYGDSRATQASRSAVKNYEKQYGLKDGKPKDGTKQEPPKAEPPVQDPPEDNKVPAWAREIVESNKLMKAELDSLRGEKTASTRQSKLSEVLKNAPESIRTRYEKDFARMNFNDEEDFGAWIEEITPDVEKIASEYIAKGAAGTPPKVGGGQPPKGSDNPYLKARIERQQAETPAPAIQGLTPNK